MVLSLILAACGGGNGDDPVGAVKNLIKAMEKLDIKEGNKYVCKAQQMEDVGEDEAAMVEAFRVETNDMKYEEKSKDDDKAVISVSGKVALKIDEGKLKEALKKEAEAAGEEVSDEELTLIVGMFTAMSNEVEYAQDVEVIKEDGKWVVCDELTIMDEIAPDF